MHDHTRSTHAFEEYHRTGDRRLRDQLVEQHLGLAYSIARRFEGRGEEREDLRQVALIALLRAVDRFDPAQGTAFATFAIPTIAGTLKRQLRDRTWLVRPPRSVNERLLAVAATEEHLTGTLRRTPTYDEVARAGGWTRREVDEATAVRRTHRLHDQHAIDDLEVGGIPASDDESDAADERMMLEELVDQLDARDRQAIELRYFADLTQVEIAKRLGVSQMHVSRILARSSAKLRALADCTRMSA
jgi:RNA polymerase sigma-B factor